MEGETETKVGRIRRKCETFNAEGDIFICRYISPHTQTWWITFRINTDSEIKCRAYLSKKVCESILFVFHRKLDMSKIDIETRIMDLRQLLEMLEKIKGNKGIRLEANVISTLVTEVL